jgi:Tfp pilus assembly protein PilE
VAIIGVLAAVAIPNFLKYQLRAKDERAKVALQALHRAEVALQQRTGAFLELKVREAAPGAQAAAWTAEEVQVAQELGWAVEGAGLHAYTVSVGVTEDGRQALAACAESDADGDGVHAAWVIFEPVESQEGGLVAPPAPCRFDPRLAREASFTAGDAPGVAIRVSPADVF